MSAGALEFRWARGRELRGLAEQYMQQHPHASFAHDSAWRRTAWECYRIPSPVLVALRGGAVAGAAPLSLLLNPLSGPYAVIGPFASYADVLADDPEVAGGILRNAARRLRWLGVGHLHVRSAAGPVSAAPQRESGVAGRFISPRVDLRAGAEVLWEKVLEVRARNAVRKARKLGVEVLAVDDLRDFMAVIDAGNRRLGSPFHGARYFRLLRRHFGARLDLWLAHVGGQPAAVMANVVHRDTLHYVYGQNVFELRSTAANALLVWHMIEGACARGLATVDLGRSEVDSPHQQFKRQWGAQDAPLWDLRVAARARSLPDITPTNPKYSGLQARWSRLPLSVTRRLGPLLIRGFG